MRVLDLFSGIGGFSLGLEACGMTTAAFCERDEFCTKILNKHWPDVPVHSDVRKLDGTKYAGSIDVVCGGFPCQPFSVSGQQRGKDDDRHLWPEMLRVISESKPRWVIGENVSGFVRMALDDVSLDLENEGYTVRTFVLPACAVDAKHRRDRVFIVAYATSPRSEAGLPRQESRKERHTRKPDHEGNQRLGWETGGDWATEPAVGRVADGVPNRVDRIKSLGNAVVPQLIQIIGELVLAADKEMNHE